MLTQVMASIFMHFDALAECSPVNGEKYAAVLPIVIKKFENRFQDCWESHQFLIYLQLHF